jgi:hypothetical protein
MSMAFRVVACVLFFIAALGAITVPTLAAIPLIPLGLGFWCLSTLVS